MSRTLWEVLISIFVVAGATGHVGSAVARDLLAKGHKVRAVVRNPERAKALQEQGALLATGELSDEGFLADALRGADAALLLLPPPPLDSPDVRAYQDRVAHAEVNLVGTFSRGGSGSV
jgi:uncharacterized protein YbjT (DUF2867 family)